MFEKRTIQEVRRQTGISDHALRYYEKVGLLSHVGRLSNGHRYYTDQDVEWIRTLLLLRNTGMPIQKMLILAKLRQQGDGTLPERIKFLSMYRDELAKQIVILQEARETVYGKITLLKKQQV